MEDHRITADQVLDALRLVPIDSIQPHPKNNNLGDLESIGESIRELGFFDPITVQKSTGYIITGNHSWRVHRANGATEVPALVYEVDDLTALRMMAAHNRTNRKGHDDPAATIALLNGIVDDAGTEYALCGTGWYLDDLTELEKLCGADAPTSDFEGTEDEKDQDAPHVSARDVAAADDEADAPPADDYIPITVPGDLWHLGPHRILCADSREPRTWATLLAGRTADLVITSPPYAARRTYDASSGFVPPKPEDYAAWYEPVAENIRTHLADHGSYLLNIKEHAEDGQRHLYVKALTITHVREWGWRFVDELCWVDASNGVPGRWPNRFKDAWEPVFHYAKSGSMAFHPEANAQQAKFVVPEGARGIKTESGFTIGGGAAVPAAETDTSLPSNVITISAQGYTGHTAPFPWQLAAWLIRAYCDPDPDALVVDPFMGSGSTLIAAHAEGRTGYGIEISPAYCDLIARRFQRTTGILPTRDGQTHDFMATSHPQSCNCRRCQSADATPVSA